MTGQVLPTFKIWITARLMRCQFIYKCKSIICAHLYSVALEIQQILVVTQFSVNLTPSAANLSSTGVLTMGLPAAPNV